MRRGIKPFRIICPDFLQKLFALTVTILLFEGCLQDAVAVEVPQFAIYELQFVADSAIDRPFDEYLLKLELTDPMGKVFVIDGFYAGDGQEGQVGQVWKARICPYETGRWSWRTVPGDRPDTALQGLSGSFLCIAGDERGGLVQDGQHFRLQNGDFVYLQGNFLDFVDGLPSTHVFMSHLVSAAQRTAILDRQQNHHTANKINVYIANRGDYRGLAVTPWLREDIGTLDLHFWNDCDRHLQQFAIKGLFTELWFFADDSNFGKLTQTEKNRLFRYTMARTSAFNHSLYVIALEWQEGWALESVRASGCYIQSHNPWSRPLSVHSLAVKEADSLRSRLSLLLKIFFRDIDYSHESWANFIASQAGNGATPHQVNSLAMEMYTTQSIPHISEEFGILQEDGDLRLIANTWANFCGGAAGGGTGDGLSTFMRFLVWSHIPFQRMQPHNELVTEGYKNTFCLAEIGHHYLVYTTDNTIILEVSGLSLKGYWINPISPFVPPKSGFDISEGKNRFDPPSEVGANHWVLWITDQTNLNNSDLYPDHPMMVK